jgi:hypothetical protein
MQINNNRKNNNNNHIPNLEEQRDIELENIIGNLMIAQYQVDKLRSRLSERIGGYGSTSIFKHNDKWYKISMRVDEMSVDHPDISSQLKE